LLTFGEWAAGTGGRLAPKGLAIAVLIATATSHPAALSALSPSLTVGTLVVAATAATAIMPTAAGTSTATL
jgi:hypothetical protein